MPPARQQSGGRKAPHQKAKVNTTLNSMAATKPIGAARNSSCGNSSARPCSVRQEPRIRLPPEENGEMAVAWNPPRC